MTQEPDDIVHLKKVIEALEAEKVNHAILEQHIMRLEKLEKQHKVST
jgi:hypothetical protein